MKLSPWVYKRTRYSLIIDINPAVLLFWVARIYQYLLFFGRYQFSFCVCSADTLVIIFSVMDLTHIFFPEFDSNAWIWSLRKAWKIRWRNLKLEWLMHYFVPDQLTWHRDLIAVLAFFATSWHSNNACGKNKCCINVVTKQKTRLGTRSTQFPQHYKTREKTSSVLVARSQEHLLSNYCQNNKTPGPLHT